MKKMRLHSFASRLTRRFIIVMLVTMTLTAGLLFLFAAGGFSALVSEHYMDVLENVDEQVSVALNAVEVSSVNNVDELSKNLGTPAQLEAALADELRLNPHIIGCGVAFEPDYYRSQGRWYEAYAYRLEDGTVQVSRIGSADHDYFRSDWYRGGIGSESGYWSEPYFDEAGAKAQLCTFVLPLRDDSGRTVGVFGADLSLAWLLEQLRENDRRENAFELFPSQGKRESKKELYSFILSRRGTYIAHPDTTRILRDTFFDHPGDTAYVQLGRDMLAGQKGYHLAQVDGEPAYVNYAPLPRAGWSMGIVIPRDTVIQPGLNFGRLLMTLLGTGLLLALLLFHSTIRQTAKPLVQLARSAEEVAHGHFDTPLPNIRHNDEIHLLRDSFADMQQSLKQYIDQLTDITTQRASMERELEIARSIQMSMLPEDFPERGEIDIFARLTPAKAVGGDLYDYYLHGDKLYFCIGDASGKGVPAALVMAAISTQFRTLSAGEPEPARLVSMLNDSLSARNETMMFATLFVGVLDLTDGVLRYCNAGHDAPLVVGRDGAVRLLKVEPNLAVGVQEGQAYKAQQIRLAPGSTVFLYTDGLTEAEDAAQKQFGLDRVLEAARGLKARDARNLLDGMTAAVHSFVGSAEQSDDLTMMAVRYLPSK